MDDLYKIVFGGFASLVGGFLSGLLNYFFQFGRNKKLSNKEKVRTLNQLLIESFDYINVQLTAFKKVIDEFPQEKSCLLLLNVPPYPALQYLKDRLVMDEYYVAFTRLLPKTSDEIMTKSGFDYERIYYHLKHDAVYLFYLIEQYQELYRENYIADIERRRRYFEKFYEFKKDLALKAESSTSRDWESLLKEVAEIDKDFSFHGSPSRSRERMDFAHNDTIPRVSAIFSKSSLPDKRIMQVKLFEMKSLYREVCNNNIEIVNNLHSNYTEMVRLEKKLKELSSSDVWKAVEKKLQ